MYVMSIKVDEKFLDEIDKYAVNHRLYRSEVVRLALTEFLDKHKEDKEIDQSTVEKIRLKEY